MSIEEFIEKAIKGGWSKYHADWHDALGHNDTQCVSQVMLDPLAWQAVGKVEGWSKHDSGLEYPVEWKNHMHRMIDALAAGETIEQFLSTL